MFFILLTFAAALSIEGLGSLVSVIGISSLFGANPIIIALAIALDVGKVVVVSLLYTYWSRLAILMRGYALMAATVTMIITSGGAAGYLSGEFQKAMIGSQTGQLKVNVLKEQQAKYEERKKQIDDQIANLPPRTTVSQRLRLINGFKAEQQRLDEQIQAIDKQLPEQQIAQITTNSKVGPILQIAEFFKVPVEEAVKWVIMAIIFVFDPLAIFLIIAGNFLWAQRKERIRQENLDDEDDIHDLPFDAGSWVKAPEESIVKNVVVEEELPKDVEPFPDYEEPINWDTAKGDSMPEEVRAAGNPYLRIIPEEELVITPTKQEFVQQSGLTRPIDAEPEQVHHASLSDVPPDPNTIVSAGEASGFRRSAVAKKD